MFLKEKCYHCNIQFTHVEWDRRINIEIGDKEYNFHSEKQCFQNFYRARDKKLHAVIEGR